MTDKPMTMFDLLRRCQWDSQVRASDAPFLSLVAMQRGYLTADAHGCFSLTQDGKRAILEANP